MNHLDSLYVFNRQMVCKSTDSTADQIIYYMIVQHENYL